MVESVDSSRLCFFCGAKSSWEEKKRCDDGDRYVLLLLMADDDEMGSCGWVTATTRTPLEKRDASTSEHLDSDLILPRFVTTLCIILLRKGGIRSLCVVVLNNSSK